MRPLVLLLLLGCAGPSLAADGEPIFKRVCAGCHKADGTGVPGFGPPLKGGLTPILAREGGTAYVAHVLVGGLKGTIESMGERYNGVMPSFATQPDATLLALMDHVVGTLNGGTPPDAAILAAARSAAPTPQANHTLRDQLLAP